MRLVDVVGGWRVCVCVGGGGWAGGGASQMAEEGVLTPLVELLRSPSVRVVRHAVGAVANLSMSARNKARIVQDGGLPRLIALLRSGDGQVQELAAVALRNLSVSADAEVKVVQVSRAAPLPPPRLLRRRRPGGLFGGIGLQGLGRMG